MSGTKVHVEVSDAVRARLDELVRRLGEGLGEALVGVLVHGSAARGEWREGRSDVDLVVVVADDAPERLRAIGNALLLARLSARIEAMLLLESELEAAADVYPLFYNDIKRCNVVVAGRDPFAGIAVADHHLRLRIEQELREARIRLRRVVTDVGGDEDGLARGVRRKVRQLRSPLRALLQLRGIDCGERLEDIYRRVGERYGLDTAPLTRIGDDPEAALGALRALLEAALNDVDREEA